MNVLLTGATGFIGSEVLNACINKGWQVSALGRNKVSQSSKCKFHKAALGKDAIPSEAFTDIDVVVHCAAKSSFSKSDDGSALKAVNVDGTIALARAAAEHGVKRFIFLSSIKVNGEETESGIPFRFDDPPQPEDPYGQSKLDAEIELKALSSSSNMELVIIRPPLVYGAGVGGNFAGLLNLVQKRIVIPLGGIKNKRSLVSLDNLVDLIVACMKHPNAAGQVFLVSDNEDTSTSQMLELMKETQKGKCILFPVPEFLIRFLFRVMGLKEAERKLFGDLQVDIEHTQQVLSWRPPYTMLESMKSCHIGTEK